MPCIRCYWRSATSLAMRTIHFVMYLPDQKSAMYRRTADVSHAVLTVANVPPNVSDRAVELSVNLTKIAFPFRTSRVVDYTRHGKGRYVNLYCRQGEAPIVNCIRQ